MALPVEFVAYGVAGAALWLFAAWLLHLSPRQRATRALAALLFSMGFAWLFDLVSLFVPSRSLVPFEYFGTAVLAWIGLAAIYFLSVYPKPRGWLGRSRWGGWAVIAVGASVTALFLLQPAGLRTVALEDGEIVTVSQGPLIFVVNLWTLATGAMLVLFAVDATRTPAGPLRRALLLVLAGFLASSLVWSSSLLLNDLSGREALAVADRPYERAVYALDEASILLPLAAAAIVLAHGWRNPDATVRREARAIAWLVLACVLGVEVATFAFPPPEPGHWASTAQSVLDAAAGVAIAAFAGYALLKHRLFDIDVKLRWTISRGAIAGSFLGVFVVTAQIAQNFLSESFGWMVGGLIAGVMLFAISPIQRMAETVALRAVPDVHGGASSPKEKRLGVYRLALALALADGAVSREEERHLARMAEELGLSPREAFDAREAIEREMGHAAA